MHSRFFILLVTLVLGCVTVNAQKQNNVWYFGAGVGLSFNGGTPVVLTNGQMGLVSGQRFEYEGCASVADRGTGALLFYTDGETVWNRNHSIMPNGNGLLGRHHSTNSAVIVPTPGDNQRYYIFTADAGFGRDTLPDGPNSGINYSVVDMRLDGGNGDIIEKNHHLLDRATEKLCVIGQYNCGGYWVITQGWYEAKYHAFLVTGTEVLKEVISPVGTADAVFLTNGSGYLKASPNRKMIASALDAVDIVELFSFNENTGQLSNPIPLKLPKSAHPYGVCFSPDNSRLYVSALGRLYQYDLTSKDSATIAASGVMVPGSAGLPLRALELGPDGMIYCAVEQSVWLPRIERPNASADLCMFNPKGVDLKSHACSNGLPGIVPLASTVGGGVAVSAGEDVSVCRGDSVRLNGTGGAFYHWSPAEGLSCTDCPAPLASPAATTTYQVTVISGPNCTGVDSVTVTVNQAPSIDAGRDTIICLGAEAHLLAQGGTSYQWSPSATLSCSDCPDPVARPDTTTLYAVTAIGDNGCTGVDTVLISVAKALVADAGKPVTICSGESVTLTASDAVTWQWSPAEGLSCTTCRNPQASPAVTTLYTVTVTNGGGCAASDTVRVTVRPAPDADAGENVAVCIGGSAQLHVGGGESYLWSPATGLSCTACADPVAAPVTTTTYQVIVKNQDGCIAVDSVTVSVIDAGTFDAGPSQTLCAGDSVQLQAGDGDTWQWAPADGLSCTDCRSPKAGPSATTLYTVTVSAAGGCSASDTVSVTVLPMPAISAGEDIAICTGESAQLHASGGISYRWSPEDGLSCVDCASPIASPAATTTYTVVGTSADGCTASDEVTVSVGVGQEIQAMIARSHIVLPGAAVDVPILLDQTSIRNIDTLIFSLQYNRGILRLQDIRTVSGALNGWRRDIITDTIGGVSLRFIAPAGGQPLSAGQLLTLRFNGYLGDTVGSELPFTLALPGEQCVRIATLPGLIMLDSVCGLSYRLISVDSSDYILKPPTPNPFNPTTTVEFSLGLDGMTQLEVLNGNGERVAVLLDQYMQPGTYTVTWDAGQMPSGLYFVRLRSGAWQRIQRMDLVK